MKGSAEPKLPDSMQGSRRSSMSVEQKARTELIYNTLKRASGVEKTIRKSIDEIFGANGGDGDNGDGANAETICEASPSAADANADATETTETGETSVDSESSPEVEAVDAAPQHAATPTDDDSMDAATAPSDTDADKPLPPPPQASSGDATAPAQTIPAPLGRVTSAIQEYERVTSSPEMNSSSPPASPKSAMPPSALKSLPSISTAPANTSSLKKVNTTVPKSEQGLPEDNPPLVSRSSTTPAPYASSHLESASFSAKFIKARRAKASAAAARSSSRKGDLDKPRGTIAVTVSKTDSAPTSLKHPKGGSFDHTAPPNKNRLSAERKSGSKKGTNRCRSNSHAQLNRIRRRGSASLPTRLKPKEIESGLTLLEAMSLRQPSSIEDEAVRYCTAVPLTVVAVAFIFCVGK